ncbi:hypothetical protein KQX64_12945 [Rhodopseudomonas palustris]|nr:hypothetical protein KQX64_12945 [Rhodopseudomonas palustris]
MDIEQQLNAFLASPAIYIGGAIGLIGVTSTIVYFVVAGQLNGQIAVLKERLSLAEAQRDDYKTKLSGASPDEARARLDKLEALLASVLPRKLTPDQLATMSKIIGPIVGSVRINNDASSSDGAAFANAFRTFFAGQGWHVQAGIVMGPGLVSKSGVGISLVNGQSPTPAEAALLKALSAAGILFDIFPNAAIQHPNSEPMTEILISSPL